MTMNLSFTSQRRHTPISPGPDLVFVAGELLQTRFPKVSKAYTDLG